MSIDIATEDDATQPRLKVAPRPAPSSVPELRFPRFYLVGPSLLGVNLTIAERQRAPATAYVIYRMETVEAGIFVEWIKDILDREHAQALLDPGDLTGRMDLGKKWRILNDLAERGFVWSRYLYEDTDQASQVLHAWREGRDAASALRALELAKCAAQAREKAQLRKDLRKEAREVMKSAVDAQMEDWQ